MKPTLSIILLLPLAAFGQGPLAPPPGPPTPSMKSLDEIAATATTTQNAVNNLAATAASIQSAVANHTLISTPSGTYTISQSGTYILTGDRTAPVGNVSIRVLVSDVVIDMNGFTITATDATSRGISASSNTTGLTVRNGTISGCSTAISADSTGCRQMRVENVSALDCTGFVISAGDDACITDCTIRGVAGTSVGVSFRTNSTLRNTQVVLVNGTGVQTGTGAIVSHCSFSGGTSYGISAGAGSQIDQCFATGNSGLRAGDSSRITRSTARACTGSVGIETGKNSCITACVSAENTSTTAASFGFQAGQGSTLLGCSASGNLSSNATASQTTGAGYYLLDGCLIKDCTATGNYGAGIYVAGNNSMIQNNTLATNGAGGGVGAGVYVQNTRVQNRIEGNNVSGNVTGIYILAGATRNIVIRNTAGGNTTNNWNVGTGNFIAPVISAANTGAFTGNVGGTALGSTDPNANFTLP